MADDQTQEHKDFFISYTGKDSQWAQWIAFELEAAGYTTSGSLAKSSGNVIR